MLLALIFMLGQSVYGQKISYTDSWNQHGFSMEQSSAKGVVINYSLTDFYMTDVNIDGSILKSINIPGIFLPNTEGAPDLAGAAQFIAMPEGAVASLNIKSVRKEVFQNIEVAPAPKIPLDTETGPLVYAKDQKIYSSDAYYPAEPVQLSEKFEIRGVDVVTLGIIPFQYNPVTKELIVYRDLVIEVSFNGGNGIFGEERLRSRWWDPMMSNLLINSESLPEINHSAQNSVSETHDYEYIIITPDQPDFISWANVIKDFRVKQGIKTGVVTTTEIGGNTVNAIESYINNAYSSWTVAPSAVLLLGDYSTGSDGITSPFYVHIAGYPDYASDNGYADVDGDHKPDIVFARITARNATELQTMITKFMDYELNPPVDANFYDKPITALGWQTERWFQICSETIGGYFSHVQGKSPTRINAVYAGNPASDPWSTASYTNMVIDYFGPNGLGYIPATPQELGGFSGGTEADVINAINAGSFLLQHRDHGFYGGWGEPDFDYYSISALNNVNNKLPFIFSINCQTGAFHRSSECFTEKFHRYTYGGQNSGALGLIAATEVSYSFVNDTYVWGVFDNLFPDFMPEEPTQFQASYVMPAFGNAAGKYFLYESNWSYGLSSTTKQITCYLFHHHGDAYLTLYTEVPSALTVTHPSSILNIENSIDVSADAGSLIAITANGTILGTANGTGAVVSIPIAPQPAGTEIFVTVTKQNYYRYEEIVDVVSGGILADFTANNTTICLGDPVTFTDQSIGNISSWDWTFSNGTPDTYSGEGPISITYGTAGEFDVSLTVGDGTSTDTKTKTRYIKVLNLEADFTASETVIPIGSSVTFTNTSTCASNYAWDFGGGNPASSNLENPEPVTFNALGDHQITLTAFYGQLESTKTMTITVTDIQYCNSGGDAGYEWIANVDIAGQANASGSSGITGYEDFTGITFNLVPGSSNSVSFTPGFAGRSKFEYWTVWIDFNNDGDFGDEGELTVSIPKSKSVATGTLSIPSDASGTTRMRITIKRDSYASPCETAFSGEVEDYTVSFEPPAPQPPVAQFIADQTTIAVGGTVNFTDLSTNDPTEWLWTFTGTNAPAGSTMQNPSIVFSSAGIFDVTLWVNNGIGTDEITKSGFVTVTNDPLPPSYCTTSANNAVDWIESVDFQLNTISNTGQGNTSTGYNYYQITPLNFTPGSSYSVTLIPHDATNRNFWRIWIDFNDNGVFDESGETVLTANNKKGPYTGVITIPSGVTSTDRMRITMKTGGSPVPCEEGFNGEIEDYDVIYSPESDAFSPSTALEPNVYPNPAENILNIEVKGDKNVRVTIYDGMGRVVDSFQMDGQLKQINTENYYKGLYFIRIQDNEEFILMKVIVH